MKKLRFRVRGRTGDIYDATAETDGQEVRIFCTCQAGKSGMCCKHRFMLLDGIINDLASDNTNDLAVLA